MKTMRTLNLPVFPPPSPADFSIARLRAGLGHPQGGKFIHRVDHFVLGPIGTNMQQACIAWNQELEIEQYASITLCETPEHCLRSAQAVTDPGVFPTFWTCAVYYKLNELFFENTDTYPFMFSFNYPLDRMQLCTRSGLVQSEEWSVQPGWVVASHPSPAPLVNELGIQVRHTTSNSQAAALCASGETELCITTAKAAALHDLDPVHEFGSPIMVFFIGTTKHGLNVLRG